MIGSLAGNKNYDFMEIMVVISKLFLGLVFNVKKTKFFIQISGFFCLIELF